MNVQQSLSSDGRALYTGAACPRCLLNGSVLSCCAESLLAMYGLRCRLQTFFTSAAACQAVQAQADVVCSHLSVCFLT